MKAETTALGWWFLPAGVVLALVACSNPSNKTSLPRPPKVVTITMREYGFDYNHVVPTGRVVFMAENRGRQVHQLILAPLNADFPPIDAQLHGSERRILPAFASTPDVGPGQVWVFAVDLAPDTRYAMVCFDSDSSGKLHALEGMNSEFRTPQAHG